MRLFGRIQHEFGLRHSKRIKDVRFRNMKEFLAWSDLAQARRGGSLPYRGWHRTHQLPDPLNFIR
jgi:hypothetical protein